MPRRKKLVVHVHDCMPLISSGAKVIKQEIISLRTGGDKTVNDKRKEDVSNKNLSAYELVIQRKVAQKRKLLQFLKMAEAKASYYEEIGHIKRKNKRVKGKFKNKWTHTDRENLQESRIADTSDVDYSKSKKDEDTSSSNSSDTETSFLKVIRDIKRKIKPVKRKLKARQAHTDKRNSHKRKISNALNVDDSRKKADKDNSK